MLRNFVSKLLSVHKEDPAFSVPKLGKMRSLASSEVGIPQQLAYIFVTERRAAILHPPLRWRGLWKLFGRLCCKSSVDMRSLEVMYTAEGWLDRNNDAVSEDRVTDIC